MTKFPAYMVAAKDEARVAWLTTDELPAGEVLIDTEFSSLNYKDALACRAHPGVVAQVPHVPGIDCAGVVAASDAGEFSVGQRVLVTGYDLGSGAWGGFAGRVRVPAAWPVALPAELTTRRAMLYGTAGFTAAQSVEALLRHDVQPSSGPVLVTGATGGVGLWAVAILAKLGFEVVAMTGKPDRHAALQQLGVARFVGRDAFAEATRPLLKSQYAGGIDTVGGAALAGLIASTQYRGCVTACGLVAGADLPLTVYPFLLRGVTLVGIDSAKCPREPRLEMWRRLAGEWSVELPDEWVTTVTLDGVADRVAAMFSGQTAGRTLVEPTSGQEP